MGNVIKASKTGHLAPDTYRYELGQPGERPTYWPRVTPLFYEHVDPTKMHPSSITKIMEFTKKQSEDEGKTSSLDATRRKFLLDQEQLYTTTEHERRWPKGLTPVVLEATLGNAWVRRRVNHLSLPWSPDYRDEKEWASQVTFQSLFGPSHEYGITHPYEIKNGAVSHWFDDITSQCGIWHDYNRATPAARKMYPWANGAPHYEEYNAMKASYACFNLQNPECSYLTAEMQTFGLMADQITQGIVEGSHRYEHDVVHTPHENERPTYDNHFRDSVIPATEFRSRYKGHMHDAAVRIRNGIGYRDGVTLPWHELCKDCLN